uniref:Cysteine-rich secretory protein LCCL domain containing 1a n=1 Tax=Sinocyclocheilus anshuiensis TaxID=1608454 RepID=A0A671MWS8_9TELE
MGHLTSALLRGLSVLLVTQSVFAMVLFNATDLGILLEKYLDDDGDWMVERQRSKRAITASDMQAILDLHNKLRGQVYPPASNMEYMVWDTELERGAQEWAETCLWEHGPTGLLPQIGQNLGVHWGRYRPPTSHLQAWYDEVKDYSFPYPQECNPHCPFKCSGPVCTHYTQLVWATSSRIGCAINVCYNMNVWGQIWAKAIYLVCNYSPKGNWWGYAPYKHGTPCSACPPSYGGLCRENLCYKGDGSNRQSPREETDERNSIELEAPHSPGPRLQAPSPTRHPNAVVSKEQMSQIVTCDIKLRDQCKGTTCNRYECPAGCLDNMAKVIGTVYYDMKSSICRSAIHAGILSNESGGYVDVMPTDNRKLYISSYQNGIVSESLQNPAGGKAFRVFAVI